MTFIFILQFAFVFVLFQQETTTKYADFPLVWLNAYVVAIGALMDTIVAVALTGRTTYAWMLGLNVKLACYLYSVSFFVI